MSATLKRKIHEIVFEADTKAGKTFDVVLLILILLSILVVSLESVYTINKVYGVALRWIEWVLTILFTFEYILRVWLVNKARHYMLSFFGIVDLLSILPTFLSLVIVGSQSLLIFRSLRLLRIFRVFKLGRYLGEGQQLVDAMRASRAKIIVFVSAVLTVALILGTFMYLVEGAENGFTSIPRSFYWAIVTMTTVGYGDIAPQTVIGQSIATLLMVLGYGIIAVPTGIVSVEFSAKKNVAETVSTQVCQHCSKEGHDADAHYCKYCGHHLL
ncbi:ion transporter [Persicobacter psychrovividus]|uniref:Ion transporter n=1 Tax=Persicobacter psychrovividus TaxID=387638 RepID=A0ABM7VKH4_9BACT|nr:ion transporter [Persicobacter psychrovividus]